MMTEGSAVLRNALDKAVAVCSAAQRLADRTDVPREPHVILSCALYQLAFEHGAGILCLMKNEGYASALALFRPAYEALLRGVWVAHAAPKTKVSQILQRQAQFPKNNDMSSAISDSRPPDEVWEAITGLDRAVCMSVRHDFTHGGIFQVSQMYDGTAIGPNYSEELLTMIVQAAGLVLSASALGSASLSGQESHYTAAVELLKAPLQDLLWDR